jgi:hypothetical protein
MPALFRKAPDLELVERFLQAALGLRSLHDQAWFSRSMIRVHEAELLLPELEPYYMPCKAKDFLFPTFTPSRALTILRHLVRAHGYDLHAQERSNGGVKSLWYSIQPKSATLGHSNTEETIEVRFD